MAQQNPGGQPPTFKSNVNRAKTKKWIEAKSYSYDGDDWGDVDDYDEYGGYDEPPPLPQPVSRTTGLRQRGQSASQPADHHGGPLVQPSPYGELGHTQPQQLHGERSFTQPSQQPGARRQNSFEPEQERRAFSGGPPQFSGQRPATSSYPTSVPPNQPAAQEFQSNQSHLNRVGPTFPSSPPSIPTRKSVDDQARYPGPASISSGPYRGTSSPQRPGQPNIDSTSQPMASNDPSLDFHNRRDFSPSAMPPPLQTRDSPSPSRGGSRPPRTSSLGQENAPQLPIPTQAPSTALSAETVNTQHPQRDRASSSQSNKSLPFVRPADIYRRMEEERERQRQSQESTRPSMEAIVTRPKLENKGDSELGGRSRQVSSLDPVQERRRSEFALEGSVANTRANTEPQTQPQPTGKVQTTSKRFEIKKPSNDPSQSSPPSLGPLLPDVTRISGFGDSFGESFMGSNGGLGDFSAQSGKAIAPPGDRGGHEPRPQPASRTQPEGTLSTNLQHQPSLGFTSAVHQSFDIAQDEVPHTPSSAANSSIERSASGGTGAVSPIISRGPSTATEPWNNSLPAIDDMTSPVEHKQFQSANPKTSSVAGKPSLSRTATEHSLEPTPSPPFIPGHRRDMSTPSPDNSPARTPAVEAKPQLRSPQEVELAETTPTESESSADDQVKRDSRRVDQYPTPDQLALSEGRGRTALDHAHGLQGSGPTNSPSDPVKGFARERTDSAGSRKFRDLAEKFVGGGGSRPQSSHSNTTPRASMLGSRPPGNGDLLPPRPINERMESFRPHLPGGWESSASIAPAANSSGQVTPAQFQHEKAPVSAARAKNPAASREPVTNTRDEAPSTIKQVKDASQDAFAAVATAGDALAASLAAAVDMGHRTEEGQDSEEEWEEKSDSPAGPTRDRVASVDSTVHSEDRKPRLDPRVDKDPSAAPTPLPKDTPKNLEKESAPSEYFADSLVKPPTVGDQSNEGSRRNSHQLPPLSTDLQHQRPQYESDRLRREIEMELAPTAVSEPSTAESNSPYPTSSKYSTNQSADPSSGIQSGAVPRGYEDYWDDDNSEEVEVSARSGQSQKAETVQSDHDVAVVGTTAALGAPAHVEESIQHRESKEQAPLGTVEATQTSHDRPQILPHRFSWEVPLQELPPQPEPELVSAAAPAATLAPAHQLPTNDFLGSAVYPEGHSMETQDATARNMSKRQSDQSSTVAETSTLGLNNSIKSREGYREIAVDSHNIDALSDHANSRAIEEARRDKELPSYPGDAPEVAQYSSEKHFLDTSSFAPGSDQQSNPSPALHEQSPHPPTEMSTPITPKATDAPLPPAPTGSQPNIPTFRSLLALKTPAERIRAYDSTREQFANLNTGLAHWLAATTNDLPEHSDILSNQGRVVTSFQSHKPSPSRSGGPSGFGPSSNAPTYAPGFSPSGSGGKISSKEVQAKSKELLHTAGVFGGKGIVAGKGLFSKGKSKLRGASGTDKALPPAVPSSGPDQTFRGLQGPARESPDRGQEHSTSRNRPSSYIQSEEPQRHPSEGIESDRNTPSEQSYSKGQLGDDERSSEDYESADSGPVESGPPPPRSSSLFIGDRNATSSKSQPLPKSTTSSGETARAVTQQTAIAGTRKGTQSPRSTNSSNKTPTQLSFDHSKAMPGMPYSFERTESPKEVPSAVAPDLGSSTSSGIQLQPQAPPISRNSSQDLKAEVSPDIHVPYAEVRGRNASSTDQAMNGQLDSGDTQPAKRPSDIQTNNLILPVPKFSPLMGEPSTGMSLSPDLARDPHSRGLSIGSVPSALDPERPPSPVSPPVEDSREEQRGRTIVPVHHGIHHDFVDESSVERARRRSSSFSRPFQTGRTSDDSRPVIGPDLQDHPAFRQSSDSREAGGPVNYHPGLASSKRSSIPREQAPEYQSSGQGAPDIPSVENQPQYRRGSRSSTYLKAIRDSVSPSRRSQAREKSQHRFPDSSRTSDSPHSFIRLSNPTESEEKPRRSSVFDRIKTNNSSASDQAQSKGSSAPRAATMPVQHPIQTSTKIEKPIESNSPASSKMSGASRFGQKLQRASTTVNQANPELDGGKKKRFSGIGSLFGRNQKRQSSDQSKSMPPQLHQHYGKYTGRPRGPTQRFPLDEDPDEAPPPGQGHYAPPRVEASPFQTKPLRQPHAQPQRDLPAYVQDRMLRQPTGPMDQQQAQPSVKASTDAFNLSTPHNPSPSPQPNPTLQQGSPAVSHRPSTTRSTSSWARFSQSGRSNSDHRPSQAAAPPPQPLVSLSHIKDFVSSPPLTYESRPTQRSWIEGTNPPPRNFAKPPPGTPTENERAPRSESPPPPPPPKDDRWTKPQPSSKPLGNHTRSGSVPLQNRSPAATQRQSLPPLQTNVTARQPRVGAESSAPQQQATSNSSNDRENMSPEEKRKSRQEEIEKGHLSPASVMMGAQKGKMSAVHEDEGPKSETPKPKPTPVVEDEPIVMSATSFPGQMWQPDYMAWEGE